MAPAPACLHKQNDQPAMNEMRSDAFTKTWNGFIKIPTTEVLAPNGNKPYLSLMNIKQWLITTTLLTLAFSPTWGEAASRLSDEEKREDAARVLETSQGIIKIVIFETL